MKAAVQTTMRAAVLAGAGAVDTRVARRPDPQRGQVRVRVEGCGVCASSLPVWEGRPWFAYPAAPGEPGHEGWGTVDAVGDGVDTRLRDRRVAFLSTRAFAQWDVCDAEALAEIPAALDGRPMPGEALACAVNAFARAGIEPSDLVLVVGVGFLGAAIVALAADAGATVVACSRRAFARRRALELGAVDAHAIGDPGDVRRALAAYAADGLADVAIEAGGVQDTLDVAGALVRTGGRLVIAGYHQDGPRSIDLASWNRRGLEIVNAHERRPSRYVDGMREAFALVGKGVLDLDALFTHRVELADLTRAFTLIRDRPEGFLKAIVTVD